MPRLPCPCIASTALALLSAAWGAGCLSFDESGVRPDDPGVVDAALDAPPDAAAVCEAGQSSCDGHVLVTCDESGTSTTEEPCFVCDESGGAARCLHASNTPAAVYATCASQDHALEPPAGSMVTVAEPSPGVIELQCDPACGTGGSVIRASHVVPGVGAWFCLENVLIRADVMVNYTGHIAEPIIWLVDGPVDIAGTVYLRGSGASIDAGGVPGPGGFAGANASDSTGATGRGPCAGSGGMETTSSGQDGGGGGGGGAFGGNGGDGGRGKTPNGQDATGGPGGAMCGSPALTPLHGGSGGGGGADGACGTCGWPGGGGGGALGIASRTSISITGTLDASGGNGFGRTANPGQGQGGGGGGGAGGALLLEASSLNVTGNLVVDGGNGGASAAGNDGDGATAERMSGRNGTDAGNAGEGGSGGGGGGGRIRFNTPDGTFECQSGFVSPDGACTHGSLPTEAMQTLRRHTDAGMLAVPCARYRLYR